jgi:tRNA (guanine-N7-)-methyltransferase
VRRTRRLPLAELQPYLLEVPAPPAPLDWSAVFGNDQAVAIEVGFGKGLFLLTSAATRPGVNFLGIEIVRKYQLFAATRLAIRGLKQVRLACADARAFLRDCVAGGSVQAVHVYFPDPWWKKRHQKRRVFTPEFAAQCERVLRPGGLLQVATDVAEYFQVITNLVAEHTRLQRLPPPDEKAPEHDLDYLTNFERKFRKQGKSIYRADFERVEASPEQGFTSGAVDTPPVPVS